MKNLKFRIWDLDARERVDLNKIYIAPNEDDLIVFREDGSVVNSQIDLAVGMLDSSGDEIHEGDIVWVEDMVKPIRDIVVQWDEALKKYNLEEGKKYYIQGNIVQHRSLFPELFEDQKILEEIE